MVNERAVKAVCSQVGGLPASLRTSDNHFAQRVRRTGATEGRPYNVVDVYHEFCRV